jgi:hypothetical protein
MCSWHHWQWLHASPATMMDTYHRQHPTCSMQQIAASCRCCLQGHPLHSFLYILQPRCIQHQEKSLMIALNWQLPRTYLEKEPVVV